MDRNPHWARYYPASLRDSYSGTCLIVGNGPSINDIPEEFWLKYPKFLCNQIYLKDPSIRPTFYVAADSKMFTNDVMTAGVQSMTDQAAHSFISQWGMAKLRPPDNASMVPLFGVDATVFSYEPLKWVFIGANVVMVMLQIAYYIGFEKALLVGVDFEWPEEQTHFHPDYYVTDEHVPFRSQPGGLEKMEIFFSMARYAWEKDGREIINITPNTGLRAFRREEYDFHSSNSTG